MWVQGGTEGDSSKEALKWVRGEEDDVEEMKKGISAEEGKDRMNRQKIIRGAASSQAKNQIIY